MTISVFFKKTAMVKLAFLDRSMPAQQHSNSLPYMERAYAQFNRNLVSCSLRESRMRRVRGTKELIDSLSSSPYSCTQ